VTVTPGQLLADADLIHYTMDASEKVEEETIRKAVDFIFFLPAAGLHVPFKFLTPGRGVLLDAVYAQQSPGNARIAPLLLRR
jgi:hypothetical protein